MLLPVTSRCGPTFRVSASIFDGNSPFSHPPHRGIIRAAMRTDFAFVGVLLVAAFLLMGVALVAAALLRPKKPNKDKLSTYECGMETVGDAWVQFRVQYYLFALIFVLFDVGGVLLFPVAVAYNQMPAWTALVISLFALTLLASLMYAWRKGVLEWD